MLKIYQKASKKLKLTSICSDDKGFFSLPPTTVPCYLSLFWEMSAAHSYSVSVPTSSKYTLNRRKTFAAFIGLYTAFARLWRQGCNLLFCCPSSFSHITAFGLWTPWYSQKYSKIQLLLYCILSGVVPSSSWQLAVFLCTG